jgi:hypothetical protein
MPEGHDPTCLELRYTELPFEAREYWPEGFSSRRELCTCDENPGSEAKKPEHAEHRKDLEKWLDIEERSTPV